MISVVAPHAGEPQLGLHADQGQLITVVPGLRFPGVACDTLIMNP
jgi:hypothetical protein